MGKAIGIDLGTTNSVAAFKEAEVEVVTANDNTPPDRRLTRSVVALQQDNLIVGHKAYNQLRGEPENVIVSIKRLMGRGFGDSAVQKQLSEISYKIAQPAEGTDNSVAVWLGGKEYSTEDISAEIIKKVVQNARDYLQEIGKTQAIDQAVITVPAYFNDKQRHATRTAALKAGIIPLELLPEPTAAAISYGFSPDSEDVNTILVYDFGGGTFDASIITAAGTQFIEQGKAGDLWLGGDDIDCRMINLVKQQVAQQEQITDIDGLIAKMPHYARVRFNADLKVAVERAKVQLSITDVARIQPATLLLDELGVAIPIEVEITRKQFEEIIADLVESSIAICHQALQYSEYTADMLDVVLLVGGCSQIPYVQDRVKKAFGNKIVVHPRPMYAVAEGAAMVAAGMIDKVTTSSRDYYIQLVDDKYKVIRRGDILPVTTSHNFKTVADGQRLIHFRFFSPDEVRGEDESIGVLWLGLEQKYPAGTEILVNLYLDEKNSGLTVRATLKNDTSVSVSYTFSRGNSDEKIYQDLETAIAELNNQSLTEFGVEEALRLSVPVVQLANEIIDHRSGKERIDLRERAKVDLQIFQALMSKERLEAESNVNQCDRIVECGFMIPQPQQLRLQQLSENLQAAINSNNISQMQSLNEDAARELNNLPSEAKLIQGCLFAIEQAQTVEPTQANAMLEKFYRMLDVWSKGNEREADRLWQELQPDVNRWLDVELSGHTIATGLKR